MSKETQKEPINYYILDKNNIIVDVSNKWDIFATENDGAPDVLKDKVLGKHILDFIKGDQVRMWFESVLQIAKLSGRILERDYRCDGPDLKRFMKMRVSFLEKNLIKVEHFLIKTEKLEQIVKLNFFNDYYYKVVRCSICNKFLYKDQWIEFEKAIKIFPIQLVSIEDIICNDCIRTQLGAINERCS